MGCAVDNPNIPFRHPAFLLLDGVIQAQAVSGQYIVLRRVVRYVQLPVAGNRNNSNGSLNNVGSNGNYWSSTVDGTNSRNLNFNSSDANMNSNNRANGNSVRCLKD